jgi:integrase
MGVCSFYQFLIIRYPKVLSVVNPFHKLKLPKNTLVRRVDIITEKDIKELRKEFKRIDRIDIICVIDLLVKYGFRIGIFEDMKVDSKGNWESVSKGNVMRGKFTQKERELINETGILNTKKYNLTNIICKYTEKLFNEGKIGSKFSPHDIRHFYITKNGKDLTMGEFIKFSRGIHKNINTTLGYMNV